jgi:hypothetical protein
MHNTSPESLRRGAAAAALAITLTSCVGPSTGRAGSTRPSPAPVTAAVTATVSASTHATVVAGGDERPLLDRERLTARAGYRATGELQDIDVVFTAPAAPLYGRIAPRVVTLTTDGAGIHTALTLVPVAGLRVFPSPVVSPGQLGRDVIGDVTIEAPKNVVSWLARRDFLHAGPVRDHLRVGTLEGRGFAYHVARLSDRARACGLAPGPRCAATIWAEGTTLHLAPGDSGSILQVDVAGQPVLAITGDEPATDGLLDHLRFDVAPVPKRTGDASRLPYLAALEPGTDYYVDRVADSVGLVITTPRESVTGSQRGDVMWIGGPSHSPAPRHYYFTAFDTTTVVSNPNPALNPNVLVRPGGIVRWELDHFLRQTTPIPDDPIDWLTQQPYVVVVDSAHDTQIAGHPARVTDVKAARRFDTITCPDGIGNCVMPFAHQPDAFPIVISSEYVTRLVDLTIGGRHILIAADLHTPGETILQSLRAFITEST